MVALQEAVPPHTEVHVDVTPPTPEATDFTTDLEFKLGVNKAIAQRHRHQNSHRATPPTSGQAQNLQAFGLCRRPPHDPKP